MNTKPTLNAVEKMKTIAELQYRVNKCLDLHSAAIRADLKDRFGITDVPRIHVMWAPPDGFIEAQQKLVVKPSQVPSAQ